jgi:AcrR family transcriptional regulator
VTLRLLGGRCVASGEVALGPVLAAEDAGDRQDRCQQDEGSNDQDGDLHPTRRPRWRGFAARGCVGYGSLSSLAVVVHRFTSAYVKRDRLSVSKQNVSYVTYNQGVPKLWTKTIEAHRREVQEAILQTTAALVGKRGLRGVTMSQIAEEAGIGRATLYKYFPDVESILVAWHERQIAGHLEHLVHVRDRSGSPRERLRSVLDAYALISRETRGHHDRDLAAFLHGDEHVARAERRLQNMIRDLLVEGAATGELRGDVPAGELATYCLHALSAARALPSRTAVRRLVTITLAALAPRP